MHLIVKIYGQMSPLFTLYELPHPIVLQRSTFSSYCDRQVKKGYTGPIPYLETNRGNKPSSKYIVCTIMWSIPGILTMQAFRTYNQLNIKHLFKTTLATTTTTTTKKQTKQQQKQLNILEHCTILSGKRKTTSTSVLHQNKVYLPCYITTLKLVMFINLHKIV